MSGASGVGNSRVVFEVLLGRVMVDSFGWFYNRVARINSVPITRRRSLFVAFGAALPVVFRGIALVPIGWFEARAAGVATVNFVAMRPAVVAVGLIRAGGVGWSRAVVVVAAGSEGC
jgi:hypothetical protein